MVFEQTRLTRPLSRLELAGAVILIGIFISVFVQRVMLLTVAAEAASLNLTIRNLRTGITLFVSEQLLEGRTDHIADLVESDPFNLMQTSYDYGGAKTTAEIAAAKPGQWFYDRDRHELVYKVVNSDYFMNAEGTNLVRLKTVLNYDDRNQDGSYERGIDRPRSVALRVVDKYEWTY